MVIGCYKDRLSCRGIKERFSDRRSVLVRGDSFNGKKQQAPSIK